MRIVGLCGQCNRFRYIAVTSTALARAVATKTTVITGLCDQCGGRKDEQMPSLP